MTSTQVLPGISAVFSLNTMRQTYCDSLHDPKFLSLLVTVVQLDSISNMVYSPTVFQHLKRKRTTSGNTQLHRQAFLFSDTLMVT